MQAVPNSHPPTSLAPGKLASYTCVRSGERVVTRLASAPTELPVDGQPLVVAVEGTAELVEVDRLELADGSDLKLSVRLGHVNYCKPLRVGQYFENRNAELIARLSLNDWQGGDLLDMSLLLYSARNESCPTFMALDQMSPYLLEGLRIETDPEALHAWLEYWRPDVIAEIEELRVRTATEQPRFDPSD